MSDLGETVSRSRFDALMLSHQRADARARELRAQLLRIAKACGVKAEYQPNHPLADRLLKAPYAFIEDDEAGVLAKMVNVIASTKSARTARDLKAALQERLLKDAETHEVCGNWIKSEVIRDLIKDVGDLDIFKAV